MSNIQEFELRTRLLRIMQEKPYSVGTRFKIVQLIGSSKIDKIAAKAISIVENSGTEEEAYDKIKRHIEQITHRKY